MVWVRVCQECTNNLTNKLNHMATNNIDKQSFGQAGATFEAGTGGYGVAHVGEYCALLIISDATFTTLTWPELNVDSSGAAVTPTADVITGVVIPAGVTIYGQISAFTISAGAVLAYHAA